MIKVKIVPTVQVVASFYCFLWDPESETDPILKSWYNLITLRDAKMGPRLKSSGPLPAIWRMKGYAKGNLNSAKLLIVLRPLDRAVVDFTAPKDPCEMMTTAVTTLGPRKDRRGWNTIKPRHWTSCKGWPFKNSTYRVNWRTIFPCSRDSESLRHLLSCVLEIWST